MGNSLQYAWVSAGNCSDEVPGTQVSSNQIQVCPDIVLMEAMGGTPWSCIYICTYTIAQRNNNPLALYSLLSCITAVRDYLQ